MVDVQKESQIEEDIPEERQMILITIPNRRSRSLKEKKGTSVLDWSNCSLSFQTQSPALGTCSRYLSLKY